MHNNAQTKAFFQMRNLTNAKNFQVKLKIIKAELVQKGVPINAINC